MNPSSLKRAQKLYKEKKHLRTKIYFKQSLGKFSAIAQAGSPGRAHRSRLTPHLRQCHSAGRGPSACPATRQCFVRCRARPPSQRSPSDSIKTPSAGGFNISSRSCACATHSSSAVSHRSAEPNGTDRRNPQGDPPAADYMIERGSKFPRQSFSSLICTAKRHPLIHFQCKFYLP